LGIQKSGHVNGKNAPIPMTVQKKVAAANVIIRPLNIKAVALIVLITSLIFSIGLNVLLALLAISFTQSRASGNGYSQKVNDRNIHQSSIISTATQPKRFKIDCSAIDVNIDTPDKATALLIKVSGKIEDPNEKLFLFLVNQNGKAQKIDKEINKKDLFSNNYLETRVVRMTQLSKGEYRIELRSSLTEAIEDQFTFAH
jgi:hypothetical protein